MNEEVKKRMDEGEPILFIDTRKSPDWNESDVKLPGALRIHYSELEQNLDELPHDRLIIPYCTWPEEASSARAAQILLDHGFKNVYPLKGGFGAWLNAGYPLEPKLPSTIEPVK